MKFDQIGLSEEVMQGVQTMGYTDMTPVQEQCIPVIMSGRDVIGCAQTGTGKTAAYVLPLLEKLRHHGNPHSKVLSLIISPTRELAQQIDVQLQGFSYFLPVSTNVVHGSGDGIEWSRQRQGMELGADVVIATPGRLIAHLDISRIDLSHVEYFVLDEADRMLDMGFADDIMKIIDHLPANRQTVMFSATLPPKIRELAKKILNDPAEIDIAISKPNEDIDQSAYVCYEGQKTEIIRELFSVPSGSKTIIFSSSKLKVKELAFTLKRMKLNVAAMHSDLEQAKREEVMLDFKNGKIELLVATDVVARGIDIDDIGTVINFEVPRDVEDYIHRIGRTARAGASGVAITLVGEKEHGRFHQIERFLGTEITKRPLPERMGKGPEYVPSASEGRGGGRGVRNSRPKGRPSGGKPRTQAATHNNPAPQPQEGNPKEKRKWHKGRRKPAQA